jgi:hypothetical protein
MCSRTLAALFVVVALFTARPQYGECAGSRSPSWVTTSSHTSSWQTTASAGRSWSTTGSFGPSPVTTRSAGPAFLTTHSAGRTYFSQDAAAQRPRLPLRQDAVALLMSDGQVLSQVGRWVSRRGAKVVGIGETFIRGGGSLFRIHLEVPVEGGAPVPMSMVVSVTRGGVVEAVGQPVAQD